MVKDSKIDVVNRPQIMLPPGYAQKPTSIPTPKSLSSSEACTQESLCQELKQDSEQQAALDELHQKEEADMQSLSEKFDHSKSDSLGWVQKDEVEIAKKRINETLGFDPPSMAGFRMAVAIYEDKFARIDGRITNILLGDPSVEEEKYRSCVGLVVAQGNECYFSERFHEHWFKRFLRIFFNKWMPTVRKKPWCRVGDWVVIPRHQGQLVNYRGTPMMMLNDIDLYCVIEKPEYVERF